MERLIIYGVYSHLTKSYLGYYKHVHDAINILESRLCENDEIDYDRNVLLSKPDNNTLMAVHPIVVN